MYKHISIAVNRAHSVEQDRGVHSSMASMWNYLCVPLCIMLSAELQSKNNSNNAHGLEGTGKLVLKSMSLCVSDSEAEATCDASQIAQDKKEILRSERTSGMGGSIVDLEVTSWHDNYSIDTQSTPGPLPSERQAVVRAKNVLTLGRQIGDRVAQLLGGRERSNGSISGLYRMQYSRDSSYTNSIDDGGAGNEDERETEGGTAWHHEQIFMWLLPVVCAGRTVAVLRLVFGGHRPTSAARTAATTFDSSAAFASDIVNERNSSDIFHTDHNDGLWLDVLQPLTALEERLHNQINTFLDICAPHFYEAQAVSVCV